MPESSLEELKRRIAAGEYAIDSGNLADTIVTKLSIVRRVSQLLAREDDEAATDAGPRSVRPARGAGRAARRQHKQRH